MIQGGAEWLPQRQMSDKNIDRWVVNIMVMAGMVLLSCDCKFCINMYYFVLYPQLIKYT